MGMRKPQMSGFCRFPATNDPEHSRCRGGNTATPTKEFAPCPCSCHLGETYECGGCGRPIKEAPGWPIDPEEPDEMAYVHVDHDGDAIGEECLT